MKKWLAFFMGVFLFLSLPAQAQEIDLSQTYSDDNLTLNYPVDWLVDTEMEDYPGVIFNIPIAGEGAVGEGVAMTRDSLAAMLTLKPGGTESALEFVQISVDDFISDAELFEAGIAVDLTINDRDAAFADVLGLLPFRMVILTLDEETKLEVQLHGVASQFIEVMPTLYAVLNTVRLTGDETPTEESVVIDYALPDTHTREDGWLFAHPADWSTDEGNSYTLLMIPGMEETTIGISAIHDDYAADLEGWAEMTRRGLLEQVPGIEPIISELSLDEQPAMRIDLVVAEENFGFTELFWYAGDDVLIRLTVIGIPSDIAILTPVFEQIITTVEILN